MVRFLVCFLVVLVLQVQFIRGQLAHNFLAGRSAVIDPSSYKDPEGYQPEPVRNLKYSTDVGQQKRARNDARRLNNLFYTFEE
ncbi:hypothetical protein OS493_009260 [Desmophyllum pertusum]|uniref:Uncharacterized protein n=1 Tax=Desmophyllum pertusum TaxID=174260 RepID=A0A9X0CTT1_9CNID|nr:hypothetical protein OS493_009260 [Desmophyllum pertusum]